MRTNSVLVLGLNRNRELRDALFEAGLAPIVRETLEGALKKLRHDKFGAVLVDRTHADVDALEFVLNVRDIDSHIPIIVVGNAAEQIPAEVLQSQENTKVLRVPFRVGELVEELNRMEPHCGTEGQGRHD